MCSHHPSFTRQHHLLTCTFSKEQILSQQASQLQISIASRSLFMFLNICSGSTRSSVTLAHRSANTNAPGEATFLHWSPEHRHGSAKAMKIESSCLNEIPLQMLPMGMWGLENMKIKKFRWGLFEFYIFLS